MLVAYQIVFAITSIGALVLAASILFKKPRARTSFETMYSMLALSIAVWAIGRFQLLISETQQDALFWIHMLYNGSSFVYVFFLHTILIFLNIHKKRKSVLVFFYATSFISFFTNNADWITGSHYFVQTAVPKMRFIFYETAGPIHIVHIFNSLVIPLYALIEMVRFLGRFTEDRLRQLQFIIFSSILGFLGGNSILFLVYDIKIEPFPLILVPFHIITLAYAITKHHLFDIKVIATELVIFSLWLFLLTRIFLSETISDKISDIVLLVLGIFLGILLIKSVLREVEQRGKLEVLTKELTAANAELLKLDAAKSEFLSIASHQLRTPLTAIKGFSSMLIDRSFGKLNKREEDALSKIFQSSNQLVWVVDDLLNLSRIESGKIRYEMKQSDFSKLVDTVLQALKPNADAKNLTVDFENAFSKESILANFDPEKMREVVMNLLDNAIKYSPKYGKITVRLGSEKGSIRFEVFDQGIGISKEDQKRIFTKFTRTQEAQRTDPNGMGIGLYFVKRIMEDHGGKIGVLSEGEGKGSTFFVELPIQQTM